MTAEVIVLADVRRAREIARTTNATAQQLYALALLLDLLAAWLAFNAAVARCMQHGLL